MFLSSLGEYQNTLIIFVVVIVSIILVYFIFFAPKNRKKQKTIDELTRKATNKSDVKVKKEPLIQDAVLNSTDLPGQHITPESSQNEGVTISQILDPDINETDNLSESQEVIEDNAENSEEIIQEINEENPDELRESTPEVLEEKVEEEIIEEEKIEEKEVVEEPEEEVEEISNDEEKQIEKAQKEDTRELGKYHVLYRKDDNKWYVKREGSDKVLRVLDTQAEGIAWATIKALNQDTAIVIHKRDGRIRKQNY